MSDRDYTDPEQRLLDQYDFLKDIKVCYTPVRLLTVTRTSVIRLQAAPTMYTCCCSPASHESPKT